MRTFVLFAALFLSTVVQSQDEEIDCEEQYYQDISEEILKQIKPSFNVVVSTPILNKEKSYWKENGTYHSTLGLEYDANCFLGKDKKEKNNEAKQFEETLDLMLKGVKRCGEHRLLSSVLQLFYSALAKSPKIVCDKKGCDAHAAACARKSENKITLKSIADEFSERKRGDDARVDESIMFHEMLHLAGVDNQDVCKHNKKDGNRAPDEVYYWEKTCFSPKFLLYSIRDEYDQCKANKVSLENCRFTDCQLPKEINEKTSERFSYNKEEIKRACLFYKSYIKKEELLKGAIENVLVPEILNCEKNKKGTLSHCPNISEMRTRSPLFYKYIPPEKMDETTIKDWVQKSCYHFNSISPRSEDLATCAYRQEKHLAKENGKYSEEIEKLLSEKLITEEEIEKLRNYWDIVHRKAKFINDGPRDYGIFPDMYDHNLQKKHLAKSVKTCERELLPSSSNNKEELGLKGTEMCRKYKTFVQDLESRLLREWGD